MSDTKVLDKTFHLILKQMVDTGQAPHYTEIAAELGVTPEEGRNTMLFFRSEEHLQNWTQYDPTTKDGISQLDGLLSMFSSNLFKRRLDPDYFSNMKTYVGELIGELGSNDKIGLFMKS